MRWKPGSSIVFSLPTLRDLVRGKDPDFDNYLNEYIKGGHHLFIKYEKKTRIDYPK